MEPSRSDEHKRIRLSDLTIALVSLLVLSLILVTGYVSASPIDDIKEQMNGWLFDGANSFAAGMVLAALVMAAIGLGMAVAKLNFMATLIVLLVVMAMLVGIGWLHYSILLLAIILVAGTFASKMRDIYSGSGG